MKPPASIQGAALPETAIVLTATLAMVFGVIQLGVIGFLQIMVDGAAFVAAHEYALLNTSSYYTTTQRIFPQVLATPSPTANTSDTTSVPVNYNTSATTSRQGGVSLIRRNHLQMSVTRNAPSGVLGVGIAALSNVQVQGSAIEPNTQVSNDVYDVNAAGYSGGGGTPMNYFNDVQNAPANYISMEIMTYCNIPSTSSFVTTCPAAYQNMRTLGNGEFLDHDNWQRTTLGAGFVFQGATFAEMMCHQRYFANAVSNFPDPQNNASAMPKISHANLPTTLYVIYGWDYLVSSGGSESLSENNFDQYPLTPAFGCP